MQDVTTKERPSTTDPQRRAGAWDRLQRLQERVSARNQDPTDEQVEAIAEDLSRAAIASLVERGEVTFERDKT